MNEGFTPFAEGNYSVQIVAYSKGRNTPFSSQVGMFNIVKNAASKIPGLIITYPQNNEISSKSRMTIFEMDGILTVTTKILNSMSMGQMLLYNLHLNRS